MVHRVPSSLDGRINMSTNKRPAPISFAEQVAEAKRRAAEIKARNEAKQNGTNGHVNGTTAAAPKSASELKEDKLAAIKARVAAATAKSQSLKPPQRPLPSAPLIDEKPNGDNIGRGGLSIGIHPALLADVNERKSGFQNIAKTKEAPKEKTNPYLSEVGQSRVKRSLNFNHNLNSRPAMEAANAMRRQQRLEEMKARIQQQTSKAGLEDTTDVQAFKILQPPAVEWWDEDIENDINIISNLVLHPIPIEAAQEKYIKLKPSALKMTKKEQKKKRKIERQAQNKEQQAMIRLGMVPAPEPKITHSNVMKVYGELAVKDPTKVEQMVRTQIAERKDKHETDNAERQLTEEQRLEKIKRNAKENAAMGLTMSVYKIDLKKEQLLGKHRYKIDMNAKQCHDISGLALVAPSFTLCLVEAGQHSTKKYQKLMLNRVRWKAILEGNGEILGNEPEEEEDTTCTLLWQGQIRQRSFKKWGSIREVETDTQAKQVLTKAKMDNFWTLARSSTS
jgi:U4/U6 small nuclear ribonucleoprotein PRP3